MIETYKGVEITTPRCTCCGRLMLEGFVIYDGEEHYCSGECLHSKYSEEEYFEMYVNGEGYWTNWHCFYTDDEMEIIDELMEKEEHDGLQETE